MSENKWDMVWPIEARSLDEAKAIWMRNGFIQTREMTREEFSDLYSGMLVRKIEPDGSVSHVNIANFHESSKDE